MALNARPAHTIMPGMATRDGKPGDVLWRDGRALPADAGQTWLFTNALEYGMDIQEALEFPRVCPYMGEVEAGAAGDAYHARAAIRARPQADGKSPRPLGGGQAIGIDRDRGVLIGGSDSAQGRGGAFGY